MSDDLSRYDPVWAAAEPYMRARKNDVHIPLCFDWTLKLLDHFPQADRDVCLLAILLHDIGWYAIDMGEIIEKAFRSDDMMHSDLRYQHEAEGVRLARDVLAQTGWDDAMIAQVCEIIDGHDTRDTAHHLNDQIVRDADKIWRFSVTGIAIGADWFGTTPRGIADRLETEWDKLETAPGRDMAKEELAKARKALRLHVI